MTREEALQILDTIPTIGEQVDALEMAIKSLENEKNLGEELRKVRGGITDEKVLIGFNMAVAICNKYLGEEGDNEI